MSKEYILDTKVKPEPHELRELFQQTSWAKNRKVIDIIGLLDITNHFVTVRYNEKLIGFGRASSDGIYRALIDDVVVDINHRSLGLGIRIVEDLLANLQNIDEIFLNTKPELEEFYKKLDFQKAITFTMVKK